MTFEKWLESMGNPREGSPEYLARLAYVAGLQYAANVLWEVSGNAQYDDAVRDICDAKAKQIEDEATRLLDLAVAKAQGH